MTDAIDSAADLLALAAFGLLFLSFCTVVAAILSRPFAAPYKDRALNELPHNVFAVGFVFTARALRPALLVAAGSAATLAFAVIVSGIAGRL